MYFGPTWSEREGKLTTDGVVGFISSANLPCPAFESPFDFLLDLVTKDLEGDGKEKGDPKRSKGVLNPKPKLRLKP